MRWRVAELLAGAAKGVDGDDEDDEELELELDPPPKRPPKDIVGGDVLGL